MDYYHFLLNSALFAGISECEAKSMMHCLQFYTKTYQKQETIFHIGDHTECFGIVLLGSVNLENSDVWGNTSLLDRVRPGQSFAEAYACAQDAPVMVDVIAAEPTEILFLNSRKILTSCSPACAYHSRLIRNLLCMTARKNLVLTRKIVHCTPKTIRERVLSYLSDQSILHGSCQFEIPFNRQQFADYLNVDRSALSKELSLMKRDGLLDFKKNRFCLFSV